MKKWIVGMLAAIAAAPAVANDGCSTCGVAPAPKTWGPKAHKYQRFQGWFHNTSGGARPQVAPWYTYWPYNGMYQTPGPVHGMNPYGGMLVNPYFPGH